MRFNSLKFAQIRARIWPKRGPSLAPILALPPILGRGGQASYLPGSWRVLSVPDATCTQEVPFDFHECLRLDWVALTDPLESVIPFPSATGHVCSPENPDFELQAGGGGHLRPDFLVEEQ